ncbi:MAG: lipoyl synthase [Spirochaetia bacterium]|jgi:lipoic acid synthetase|uniref:Lipoyl synthase n=2 Tax=root TaxID=1 RepID=A0A652ZXG5_9SPIR|nr:lipoyl synthase [Spirochaetia bacterium]MCE1208961.1 lipoyl synthase [Spirochaetia bacterium]MDD3820945.1 lipoyl synthase [Spirochaetales bacterium]NLX44568.1 lipoyl synthase [Treponema sp.]VBB40462.1 Lipoyl synthase [uncultured Spirochaetota bacterium]
METKTGERKPDWIRVRLPAGNEWERVDHILASHGLHTVCDEARCPNKGECWGCGTATFMIMGEVCTRGCRFCAVSAAPEGRPLRADEPEALASAIQEMGLSYAVITSVDRDDLEDRGAGHFAACIRSIRAKNPRVKIEVLTPDYVDQEMRLVAAAKPHVLAHNVETVRRLQGVRDARASFEKSLKTLVQAREFGISITKSSILLGLGETREELRETYAELRSAGVDILVMGQYLQPTPKEIPVVEYIHPDRFSLYAQDARAAGFSTVVASPFARTSYHAFDAWKAGKR